LSYDHKPEDDAEERRIREAGGYVSGGRVEGELAVRRGLGDSRFKDADTVLSGAMGERMHQRNNRGGMGATGASLQSNDNNQAAVTTGRREKEDVPMMRPSQQKVSPEPDIIVQNRNSAEDEFIVICCDGIWDVQTNQECVKMVADIFEEGESNLGLVCEEVSYHSWCASFFGVCRRERER
jgi:serine/threonine protein phosphatase PrpC